MNVFATLAVILALAALVESLVEFVIGGPLSHIKNPVFLEWKPDILRYIAYAVGVVAALLVYQFDIVYLLAFYLKADQIPPSSFGMICTGLLIGRGAQAVHDFIERFIWNRPELPQG